MKSWITIVGLAAVSLGGCAPRVADCLLPSQRLMVEIDLFFGSDISGRAPVSQADWAAFVASDIGVRFPAGFTVLYAQGEWRSPAGVVARENTRLVRILVVPAPNLAARVQAVAQSYKRQFHQEAVGVVTSQACAAF